MNFTRLIIDWYKANSRALPWRENRNPYSIWLSEIILQQTQVVQGLPYFNAFITNYPTVNDLAAAKEDEVLKLWQGLGYYSRARNLHFAAKFIVNNLNGVFPKDFNSLLELKGVGDYTAAAIASIAYKEVVPSIDGNVFRVISRVFDVSTPVDTSEGRNEIKALMFDVIDQKEPGDFNQAVMELGARVCKPKNPDCVNCPLLEKCLSYSKGNFLERPVKSKKVKVKKVFIDYLLLHNELGIIMQQRDASGIWKNLFELPNVESTKELKGSKHIESLRNQYALNNEEMLFVKQISHKLTHRDLQIRFFTCKISPDSNADIVLRKDILSKAVPKPIETFLAEII